MIIKSKSHQHEKQIGIKRVAKQVHVPLGGTVAIANNKWGHMYVNQEQVRASSNKSKKKGYQGRSSQTMNILSLR